jgi:ATP-dependent protease ClpP protease subunit
MRTLKLIALSLAFMYAVVTGTQAYLNSEEAPTTLEIPANTIVIEHTIAVDGIIPPPYTDISKRAQELVDQVKAGQKEIFIGINSGGGMLNPGMAFVRVMRAARHMGVTLTCVIDGIAMSMALIIFSECDNRYATFGSKVMWHSMAMSGVFKLNEKKALDLLTMMQIKNEKIWANTRIYFWPWYFSEHFVKETHLGVSEVQRKSFGYLQVIRDVKYEEFVK